MHHAHATPAAVVSTPLSTPNPTQKYELLYATVLSHWRRSHCETALVVKELRRVEAATEAMPGTTTDPSPHLPPSATTTNQTAATLARGSRLGRVLVLCRASLQRRALHRWVIVSSQLSTGHAVQAATTALTRERALVKETAARLAAAEEAELMTREELEVAKAESAAPRPRSMSVRAEQLLAAWRRADISYKG